MRLKKCSWSLFAAVLLGCGAQPEPSITITPTSDYQRVGGNDRIIVQCRTECAAAEADLVELGAVVNKRYENVAALSVTLPAGQLSALSALASIKDVAKNRTVTLPRNKIVEGRSTRLTLAALKDVQPQVLKDQDLVDAIAKQPLNFGFDNALNKATVLHKAGQTGKGVIVGLIDTGTANNADVVPALEGSVVGGETFVNFVDPAKEPSATSTLNDPHGTMTGTMIAGHAGFVFPNTSRLVQALNRYAPGSTTPLGTNQSVVPMVGTAPDASIYALKVFAAPAPGQTDSPGADTADVLAAMDRTITLKRNFDRLGVAKRAANSGDGTENHPIIYDALNIQVVNMSLGGASLFPGFEADDLLTLAMLRAGITVVVSAGNDGPNAMTIGSPASGYGALSVGAANDARHMRVSVDANPRSTPGDGLIFRPTDHLQVAIFSSRGPLADGRNGLHLIANGVDSFVQAANGDLELVNGTSFSSPMVAGAAALLRGAFPKATAAQVREALIKGANPKLVGDVKLDIDVVSAIDQGNGYLDVVAARDLLQTGKLEGSIPTLPEIEDYTLVQENISDKEKAGVALMDIKDVVFTADVKDLMAGETRHFFVANPPRGRLNIKLDKLTFELPADKQNQLPADPDTGIKGDRFLLAITDATLSVDATPWNVIGKTEVKTSYDETFGFSGGVVRVAVRATAINAGKMSGKLTLTRKGLYEATPMVASGSLEDNETDIYKLKIPTSAKEVTFDLSWRRTWAYYPTHDLDLLLIDPVGLIDGSGATLNNPERFTLVDLPTGDWTVMVDGYMLHGFEERYRLGIADQDGNALKVTPKKR